MTALPLIDRAVVRARDGHLSMQAVMWTMAASTVYVPSGSDPGPDRGDMRPVYFDREGARTLAVYSSAENAAAVGDIAPFLVTFSGEELLHTMPETDGLVINPGLPSGFDVPRSGLMAFRQELVT